MAKSGWSVRRRVLERLERERIHKNLLLKWVKHVIESERSPADIALDIEAALQAAAVRGGHAPSREAIEEGIRTLWEPEEELPPPLWAW